MLTLYREPVVTLIGRPQFVEPPHLGVQWHEAGTDGERLAEFAGRLCYMSQRNPANRTTAEYLGNILRQGHGSVFEHAVYVVLIEGVSRSLTHELVRHRAGFGYSQLSQRYVGESEAAFVVPPAVQGDEELETAWQAQVVGAQAAYVSAVERLMERYAWVEDRVHRRKLAREAARSCARCGGWRARVCAVRRASRATSSSSWVGASVVFTRAKRSPRRRVWCTSSTASRW
jgi:thymidylate synthase (FAD)